MSHCVSTDEVSRHFPPFERADLVSAARHGDGQAIDRVTDRLVALGLCRPRDDVSLFDRPEIPVYCGARGLGA